MNIHIQRDGQQMGPYPLEQVNEYLAQGNLLPTDPAWHEGLAEWIPLNQVGGIVVPAAATPPPFDPGAFGASSPPPVASSPPPAADPQMEWDTVRASAVCPQCNVTVPRGQVVCTNCGSHLHAVPSAGKKGAVKLIALIGGGVLVLAAAIFLLTAKKKTTEETTFSRADRIKCANNLAQIGKAFHGFSGEIDGETPHLATFIADPGGDNRARAYGYSGRNDPYDVSRWMNAYAIRQSLVNYSVLSSPLDPKAVAFQRRHDIKTFDEFRERTDISHDQKLSSYGIAMQGDLQTSDTVLGLTRNLKDASDTQRQAWIRQYGGSNNETWMYPAEPRPWSKHIGAAHIQAEGASSFAAEFHGTGGDENPKHTMDGLRAGQANWILSDGGSSQGNADKFNDQLRQAERSFTQGAASADGLNLIVLRPEQ